MQVIVEVGKSGRILLPCGKQLEISYFSRNWTTRVEMSVWESNASRALECSDRTHINFERFLPRKLANIASVKALNKQSRKLAGVDVFGMKKVDTQ